MPLVETDAIALHVFDYSETSRLLRLATRAAGRQSARASGALIRSSRGCARPAGDGAGGRCVGGEGSRRLGARGGSGVRADDGQLRGVSSYDCRIGGPSGLAHGGWRALRGERAELAGGTEI